MTKEEKRPKRACKPKYAVLCRLVDCEDDWGLFFLGGEVPSAFDTAREARAAMKKAYKEFSSSYDAEWTCDGKDHCIRSVRQSGISIDVPIWDGENERESWIRAKWKIVKL